MHMKLIAAVSCAALLSGCAHLAAPEKGGPGWGRVTGKHVRLTTDLDGPDAERETRELDALLVAMLRAAWGRDDARLPRLEVVAFRSVHGLRAFADDSSMAYVSQTQNVIYRADGFLLPGNQLRESLLVTHAEQPLAGSPFLIRMFANAAAQVNPTPMPWWLVQGTALFLGSGEVAERIFSVGALNYEVLNSIQTSVSTVRNPQVKHAGVELPVAFALVYWLRATQPGFSKLIAQLDAGAPEPVAFAQAFPSLAADELEARVDYHDWKQPPVPVVKMVLEPATAPLNVEPLPPAEVHALWARLHHARGQAEAGVLELQAALALDPANVSASLESAVRGPQSVLLDSLRSLAARAPGDARACHAAMFLEDLSHAERLACAERVLAADPDDVAAHRFRAFELLSLNRLEEAHAEIRAAGEIGVAGPATAGAAEARLKLLEQLAMKHAEQRDCGQALKDIDEARALNEQQGRSKQLFKYEGSKLRPFCPEIP